MLHRAGLVSLIMVNLVVTQVNAADLIQPMPVSPSISSDLLAADCTNVTTDASPLSARPVLARTTFASHVPSRPHRPIVRKKSAASHRPIHRAHAARVVKPVVKHAAKPVAKAPIAKKPVAAKPVAKRPRARRPIAHPLPARTPPAAPLHKATYASPICIDRAPAMTAFGLDDLGPVAFSDELAQAIEDALAPQNAPQTGIMLAGGPGSSGGGNPGSGFPAFPSYPIFGAGGGGGPGGTAPANPNSPGGTTPGAPGTPDTPGSPGTPDTPGSPGTPDTPETPGTPGTPGNPGTPGTPDTPGNPGTPGTNPTNPGAVPEPASWLMLIAGFGAIGVSLRRRRRISAAA